MALDKVEGGGGTGGGTTEGYTPISIFRTFRVLADNSTQNIQSVTVQSDLYGVAFTFFIDAKTWDTDGGPPFIHDMTGYVNNVCGEDHVVGFRSEQDLGADGQLYNYAVITVGNEDGSQTDEARVRMDALRTGAEVPAIAAAWARLQAAGVV
jgi:hypothetical protein